MKKWPLASWLCRIVLALTCATLAVSPTAAQKKQSDLPTATVMVGGETVTGLQSGANRNFSISQIRGPGALDFKSICAGPGDSRTAQVNAASDLANGTANSSALAYIPALLGRGVKLRCGPDSYVLGTSGARSDQSILSYGDQVVASSSGWIWQSAVCVNDLGQAATGYTTVTNDKSPNSGVVVSSANVAKVCADNIIAQVARDLASGHKVILEAERGVNGQLYAPVAEINQRLSDDCDARPGCYFFNPNGALYNSAGSTTAVSFKSGIVADSTHYGPAGALTEAQEFVRQYGSLLPSTDVLTCSAADTYTGNPRQLLTNTLFNTTTGGTGTPASGTVPAGWSLIQDAGMTVNITYAATNCGNDITLTITAANAGRVRLTQTVAPANTQWAIGDYLLATGQVSVAAGSSNMYTYLQAENATNDAQGANQPTSSYDLYGTTANGAGPTTAYTLTYRTRPRPNAPTGVTRGYASWVGFIQFTAAGSATVTFRRPSVVRTFATN